MKEYGNAIVVLYENHSWTQSGHPSPFYPKSRRLTNVINQLSADFEEVKEKTPELAGVIQWELREDESVLVDPGVWAFKFGWYVCLPETPGETAALFEDLRKDFNEQNTARPSSRKRDSPR